VRIRSGGIASAQLQVEGQLSSQFISALLLAAPLASGTIEISVKGAIVSKPYIDLTIEVMRSFGANVERRGYSFFRIDQAVSYVSPGEYSIEGDASAASYFLGLGALPGSGPIAIEGIPFNSIQGDARFTAIIESLGGRVLWQDGLLIARGGGQFRPVDLDLNQMPDAAMTLAVLCAFAPGLNRIENIANLELKESRRLTGLASELNRLGVKTTASATGLEIHGGANLHPARIETYKDHRMAMAFSLASYGTDLTIMDPGCVSKTYPDYFSVFNNLARSK
jgi:3-phosphoshikimate 1-carboxyvinyltransferase